MTARKPFQETRGVQLLAPPGTPLHGPLPAEPDRRETALRERLQEIARVADLILDKDAARDMVLPLSRIEISPDDYNVDGPLFDQVKVQLLKVELLTDLPISTGLRRESLDQETVLDLMMAGSRYPVHLVGWDRYQTAITPGIRAALDGGIGHEESADGRCLSQFTPLVDSMGDVIGLLQLCVDRRQLAGAS